MSDEEFLAWAEQFANEHAGMYPHQDEHYSSEERSLQEHLDARQWGIEFMQMTGRIPDEHDYRYRYFGGFTPENGFRPDWYRQGKPKPRVPPVVKMMSPMMAASLQPNTGATPYMNVYFEENE